MLHQITSKEKEERKKERKKAKIEKRRFQNLKLIYAGTVKYTKHPLWKAYSLGRKKRERERAENKHSQSDGLGPSMGASSFCIARWCSSS